MAIWIFLYLVWWLGGFYLALQAWRTRWDVTTSDLIFHLTLSLVGGLLMPVFTLLSFRGKSPPHYTNPTNEKVWLSVKK